MAKSARPSKKQVMDEMKRKGVVLPHGYEVRKRKSAKKKK